MSARSNKSYNSIVILLNMYFSKTAVLFSYINIWLEITRTFFFIRHVKVYSLDLACAYKTVEMGRFPRSVPVCNFYDIILQTQ